VPDGIERAGPTLAPSRRRLTSELAKSRFHHIQPDRKQGPPVATTTGSTCTSSLVRMSSHLSKFAGEAVDNPEHREGLAMLQANHRIYFFPFVTSPGNRVSTMVTWPLIFLNQ